VHTLKIILKVDCRICRVSFQPHYTEPCHKTYTQVCNFVCIAAA